jgi:hypothetical protein
MAVYDTLEQLRNAYAQHAVTTPLMIDNDNVSVYDANDGHAFEMHPADLLLQALDLLGIPYEYV